MKTATETYFKTNLGTLSEHNSDKTLAGIEVVVVMVPAGVRPARAEFPGLPIYTPKEVKELQGLEPENVLWLHDAKVIFNGQIRPGANGAKWKTVLLVVMWDGIPRKPGNALIQ